MRTRYIPGSSEKPGGSKRLRINQPPPPGPRDGRSITPQRFFASWVPAVDVATTLQPIPLRPGDTSDSDDEMRPS